MLNEFKEYIEEQNLFGNNDKILLAVSGGGDSMVMLNLFHQAGYKIAVAHCNFCLRGEDADLDQKLVEKIAEGLNIECFVTHFDTNNYAHQNKLSIQMAARELRYNWFNEIMSAHQFSYVAVATHNDDAIETFILNASKGSGIKGLSGIKPKNGKIVRPLLFASKEQITRFAQKNELLFRNDKSNDSLKYLRNKIRHKIIPVLKEINPSLTKTFQQNFENLSVVEQVYLDRINQLKQQLVVENDKSLTIDFELLKKTSFPKNFLFEFIKDFGYTPKDCADIVRVKSSGQQFFSKNFELIVNRNKIEIREKKLEEIQVWKIDKQPANIITPIRIKIKEIPKPKTFKSQLNIAIIDADKIKFPLVLRKWKKGDYFYPLGMNKRKKLSDFFIDEKFSLFDKQEIYILTSADDEIIWIVNHRLDNRFKLSEKTKKVLEFSLEKV